MTYSILTYGHHLLREETKEINENYPSLHKIIDNMWETMYNANGVGLAAPQVGRSIKLFIVDAFPFENEDIKAKNFKKVFINPIILQRYGEKETYKESCLSFPGINEEISRFSTIIIKYFDENFNLFEETYDGVVARIIQHEYDHLEGKLLVDHISYLRKTQISKKLSNIIKKITIPQYKIA